MVLRRPRRWETEGMKGMAMSAPREYIALRRPRREEVGLSKSGLTCEFGEVFLGRWEEGRTVDPGLDGLEAVHHGRVEAGGPFNAQAGGHEDEVQEAQVGFLVPWVGVGLSDPRQARVDVLFFGANDCHGLVLMVKARVTSVMLEG